MFTILRLGLLLPFFLRCKSSGPDFSYSRRGWDRKVSGRGARTGVQELTETGVGREEQDEVVERNGADEVQQEPGPHVAPRYLVRLQDDLVGEVVRYDACTSASQPSIVRHDTSSCIFVRPTADE